MFPSLNEQIDLIKSGTVDLIPEEELVIKIEKSIATGRRLNVKLGCDPSKPDLHIGHAVVLNKMRQFQDLGHQAILIIGDFTAMIGDPTGKSKTRPQLTMDQTRDYGKSYLDQATKILSSNNLTVRYNSEWLSPMTFSEVIELTAKYTVAQLLERDDFSKRYRGGQPISVHELLYPLAQAMDSAAIDSDIELGGTDQKFNLLVGREIQRSYGKQPQVILTMPILEGTDGVEKMSKSLGNYIAFNDSPRDIFGKVMSIPDNLITRYYQYGAFSLAEEVELMNAGLSDGSLHPRTAKVNTAMKIVEIYHDANAAQSAFEEFEKMFVRKDIPDDIDELELESNEDSIPIVDALVLSGMMPSKGEARRMIQQGAISVDGEKISRIDMQIDFKDFRLIKAGKRKFLKIKRK